MIKEIKKIYSIELVKFDGNNEDELVKLSEAEGYDYYNHDLVLKNTKQNISKDIIVPIGSYLVKVEEYDTIFVVDTIRSLFDMTHKGELSIEDETLIKELINSYAKEVDDEKNI